MTSRRLSVTLDGEHASRLSRLAARAQVSEQALARHLLSSAIDGVDPDAATILAVIDGIDGAWERAQIGRAQATAGDTVSLEDL